MVRKTVLVALAGLALAGGQAMAADVCDDGKIIMQSDNSIAQKEADDLIQTCHLAFQGDADAQFRFGLFSVKSHLYEGAAKFLRMAASQGHARAQFALGYLYENGLGVNKDYHEAMQWYRLSANQGNASGEIGLGDMYSFGEGTQQDYAEASKWYKLAAKQGNSNGMYQLGQLYAFGKGVPQDFTEAAKWFERAAIEGSPDAQSNLGTMYFFGHGVQQNLVFAHMWFNIASANGDIAAERSRDTTAAMMTHEQVNIAERLARECQEKQFQSCGYNRIAE